MSRSKRRSLDASLNAPEPQAEAPVPMAPETADGTATVDLPVDNFVTPSRDKAIETTVTRATVETSRRRSPGDQTRHSYHASLYLPEEAQFALREIALVTRRPKPHDVMLEAMADLFERYNKSELAAECRRRMTSRDKAKA